MKAAELGGGEGGGVDKKKYKNIFLRGAWSRRAREGGGLE